MNRLYPLFVKLERKPCLIVGGGPVAAQKIRELLECGARVTVISPEAGQEVQRLIDAHVLQYRARDYITGDAIGNFLCVAATDNIHINETIAADCTRAGVLCNVVDVPHLCGFYAAAVFRRGDLKIAISTNGKSPALAKMIRLRLEKLFGGEYGLFLRFLGRLRTPVMKKFHDSFEKRRLFFDSVVNSNTLRLLQNGEREAFLAKMREWHEILRERDS